MNKSESSFKPRMWFVTILLAAFVAGCGGGGGGGGSDPAAAAAAATAAAALTAAGPAGLSPNLKSGATYGVVAGPAVTLDGGPTDQIVGDLAVSPGSTRTGPGTVSGSVNLGNAVAAQARQDMNDAFTEASTRIVAAPCPVAGDLQAAQGACNGFTPGPTYRPGLYNSSSTLAVTGTIILDAQGNPDAVFIFRLGSFLTTATSSTVTLANGAKAKNVWWIAPSGATLGVTSAFAGTVLADTGAATLLNDATVLGRLFSNTAAVTVNVNSVITVPGP